MKKILIKVAILIIKILIKKGKNDKFDAGNTLAKQAYGNMIKNYEDTIIVLTIYEDILKNSKSLDLIEK